HSREQLTALFWPESDAAHGRAMLRRTLAFLRDTLGDSAAPPGQAHLLVARATLGFNPHAAFSLDTQPFAGARTPEQLQAAVGAYRGDFLADFLLGDAPEFDDWVARRREAWHTQIAGILDRLSQAQIAAGDAPAAQASLARWLALDPLNETAYLRRIRLHLAAGDRPAALRVYEAARAQLAQELGLAPSPALAALAERIRLDAPVPAPAAALRPVPVPRPPLQAPLVGRGAEFVKLVERYHLAHRDGLHVVVVEGEAGIGKTRLAREFLGWAQAHDIDVWAGQALETGGRIPYQPLVEALRRRLECENAPADLLSDIWLAELSRLLPELRDRYPDLAPPPADESAAGARLFEAVTRLGLALAARTPAVLFLDDLQWADAASRDLLQYALRRWAEERARLMVLLTLRAEAPAEQPALATWLAAVRRGAPITAIALGPLTQADTVRWVQALGPGGPAPPAGAPALEGGDPALVTFGDWLFAQTGGQPFYISETLQALTEQGAIVFPAGPAPAPAIHFAPGAGDPAAWGRLIPAGVREVVRRQLARFDSPAFRLLAAGAVLGHDFRFEQLCAVADLPEPEALAALDAVLHAHLWREAGGGTPPAYAFTHDTIRDVVYDEAGAARRRIFHRRALGALQPAAAPPAVLAHHALQADLVGPTCHFSLIAGDGAMRVFAVRDAIGYYEQAHALARPPPGAAARPEDCAPGEWAALLCGLGRAYEFVNDWPAAEAVYGEWLAFGRQADDAEAVCLALNRLAAVAYQGRFDLRRAEGLLH
ncbi:MAG TPA: AAA family ATPase, partial [Chloroflexia bacterium]|nr:AAA family ATPase [Chloroflexia bacterium]